jgi:hypothetical protein
MRTLGDVKIGIVHSNLPTWTRGSRATHLDVQTRSAGRKTAEYIDVAITATRKCYLRKATKTGISRVVFNWYSAYGG